MRQTLRLFTVSLFFLAGCSTVYYSVWEKLGYEKRDLLRGKLDGVKSQQERVSEQVKDSLERLTDLYGRESTPLDAAYRTVKADFERCEKESTVLKSRIVKLEDVAKDLFDEWDREIVLIHNADFRMESTRKLTKTRARFDDLDRALRKSADRMGPVLDEMRDQMLFLKHNLNSQVIGKLGRTEMQDIERQVSRLLADMRESIRKSSEFIDALSES